MQNYGAVPWELFKPLPSPTARKRWLSTTFVDNEDLNSPGVPLLVDLHNMVYIIGGQVDRWIIAGLENDTGKKYAFLYQAGAPLKKVLLNTETLSVGFDEKVLQSADFEKARQLYEAEQKVLPTATADARRRAQTEF